MRTSRKVVLASLASAVVLALAIPVFTGALNARAAMGLSNDVDIFITDPGSALIEVNVFTEGGAAPSDLPIFVEALVDLVSSRVNLAGRGSASFVLDGVDFALNGTLDADARTLTDADDVAAGERILNPSLSDSESEWEATLDLASGTFSAPVVARGTPFVPSLVSSSIIRAFVSISSTYVPYSVRAPGDVLGWDDFDEISAEINVFDPVDVNLDVDDNGKPDADGLAAFPSGTAIGTSPDGNVIIASWVPLDAGTTRGAFSAEVEVTLQSANGDVNVSVTSPTLALIQAVSTAYDGYDEGRLVIVIAGDPIDLLDGPTGVDPLSEFTLLDAVTGAALPAPTNVFVLINIFVRDSTVNPAEWLALEDLPGGLGILAELSGAGIAAELTVGDDVRTYTYNTTNTQDPVTGALTDDGDVAGWEEATTTLARVTVVDTSLPILSTFPSASVIFGSNATPSTTTLTPVVGGGGGSSGICFIATAAYGTPLADEINVLRGLRDSYMLNNVVGAAFVDTYYRLSPPVADVVAHNAFAKALVRTLLVPIVMVSGLVLALPGATAALLLVAFAFAAYRLRRKMTRS